jgi:hypothetical protein
MLHYIDPPPDERDEWQQQMGDSLDDQVPAGLDQWQWRPSKDSDDDQGSYQDQRIRSLSSCPLRTCRTSYTSRFSVLAVHREVRAAQNAARRAGAQERGRAARPPS